MALTDNLISYWKLDGNSTDSVGSNNGTDTSVSYFTGLIGQAGSLCCCKCCKCIGYCRKCKSVI